MCGKFWQALIASWLSFRWRKSYSFGCNRQFWRLRTSSNVGTKLAGRGRHWNFDPLQCLGPRPEILDRYISLSCLRWYCRQRATSDSRIFIGLSGSRDWSHGESHGPDRPMPAAILENFHCEQPCYGFLGLLKFLCFQTLPNLVNCFLIIFSLVWHPKDFAQIKITHGKNASNPSNRSAIVKSFSLCFTSRH